MVSAAPIAEGSSKFLGNITNGDPPSNFAEYWNQITLENGGKWGSVQPSSQNGFNWGQTDAAYDYCKSKGWPYKHHCFVWGNQQPAWVNNGNARAAVENYIKTYGSKYPATELIDVVNEPLHAPAPYREGLGGNGSTGWDWVVTVFQFARHYCPASKLILNDYGIVNDVNATRRYLEIIRILQDKDLIDGIGVQAHCFNIEGTSTSTIKRNLDSLASTGLPVYPSEFDLTGDENTQLDRYKTYFPVFWEHPAVAGVTLWGYTHNWKGGTIMSGGREYAALKWLRTYVDSLELKMCVTSPVTADVSASSIRISFPGRQGIRIIMSSSQKLSLSIIDPTGRIFFHTPTLTCTRGDNIFSWPRQSACRGVYAVVAKGAGFRDARKTLFK